MIFCTRSRVSAGMRASAFSAPLSTSDTVAWLTPASLAMSCWVRRRAAGMLADAYY